MTYSLLRRMCGVFALILLPLVAHAGDLVPDNLPPGLSGTWYNPAQSGHGLSITVHSGNDALVYWYTGDAQGNPLLLYSEAQVQNGLLVGDALESRGIRFGDFDPATNRLTRWGAIELEVLACDRLILRFNANGPAGGPAYGRGEIEMHKLAGVDELPCVDRAPNGALLISPGLTRANPADPWNYSGRGLNALFSADGSVWLSFENGRRMDGAVLHLRSYGTTNSYSGYAYHEPALHSTPTTSFAPASGSFWNLEVVPEPRRRKYAATLGTALAFDLLPAGLGDVAAYRREVALGAVAGIYDAKDAWITFILRRLTIRPDGLFEGFDAYPSGVTCRYQGELRKAISPSIEFDLSLNLSGCNERDGEYTGKGWVDSFDASGAVSSVRMAAIRATGEKLAFQFAAPRER